VNGSLTIREAEETDRDAVLGVIEAAFGQRDEATLVERLWADGAVSLELVAEQDGVVIGHCAFTLVTSEPPLKGAALGLAPLSVAPTHQNSGVGAALVETGLDICKTRGASLMVVLGEPDYYRRFGFEPASKKNISWAAMDAGDAFQAIDWAGLAPSPRKIHYHAAFSSV